MADDKYPYTGTYDRPAYVRGDTIPAFTLTVQQGDPPQNVTPTSARAQLRTAMGKLLHEFAMSIDPDGKVRMGAVQPEDSARFPLGKHYYDVEVTLPDGRVLTYLRGTMKIVADVTR